jgi:parvulin-like peptidyl-prolyl cis-trans isomerase-like protein
MRRLLREPLLHFLLLSIALFGVYALARDKASDRTGQIVVTQSQIEQLVIGFTRTWQRPPTAEELTGLIEDRIREEVLYREAMSMGLDRDDTIVRRRLRQKLEFLIPDLASQIAPPTERELEAYLQQHADKYRGAPTVSFEQVFFDRERRGKSAWTDAVSALTRLNGPRGSAVNLDTVGDASLLPIELTRSQESEVARLFGGTFSQSLVKVPPGRWAGPLESSYGLHLVLVREQVAGLVPQMASVREAVLRDLQAERRQQALDAAYAKFRTRYAVVVESLAVARAAP